MAALLLPSLHFQEFDNNGDVLAHGSVEVYYSVTGLPAVTYQDSLMTAANTHPIELTMSGKANIYLDAGTYNLVARDSSGSVVYSIDNYSIAAPEAATGEPTEAIPVGGIIMFSGFFADIPSNYQLCDGTNGTPNLVDRFPMCTVVEDDVADIGGNLDASMPAHTHTMGHSHSINHNHPSVATANTTIYPFQEIKWYTGGMGGSGSSFYIPDYPTGTKNGASQSHSHSVDVPDYSGNSGESSSANTGTAGSADTAGANLPPYVKLAFIQRMS